MHVVDHGSGPALVMLHGFGVDHRMQLPLDHVVEAAGWRRVYLDLPGHGRSPGGDVASAEDVMAAVRGRVRDVVGEEPFAILGSSYGGMVARCIAHDLREQVRGLAVLAGVFVADPAMRDVPGQQVLVSAPDAVAGLGPAGRDYAEMAVEQSAAGAEAFVRHVRPGLEAADQDVLARVRARYALDTEPEDRAAEPFDRPTLVLSARQDHVVGYRDAWARLEHYPRATFAVLDAAGHNVHLDRPPVVEALVADWLTRVRVG